MLSSSWDFSQLGVGWYSLTNNSLCIIRSVQLERTPGIRIMFAHSFRLQGSPATTPYFGRSRSLVPLLVSWLAQRQISISTCGRKKERILSYDIQTTEIKWKRSFTFVTFSQRESNSLSIVLHSLFVFYISYLATIMVQPLQQLT